MPPERLNGGAIRGSLPTARNDRFLGVVYTLRAQDKALRSPQTVWVYPSFRLSAPTMP